MFGPYPATPTMGEVASKIISINYTLFCRLFFLIFIRNSKIQAITLKRNIIQKAELMI